MIFPKKTKYKKVQKGSLPNKIISTKDNLTFGTFGFKAINWGLLNSIQIELIKRLITKRIKKTGKVWIKIFPHIPKTKKPIEIRMGKGKGSVHEWLSKIPQGTILVELDGITKKLATEIYNEVRKKLPIKIKLICY